MPGRDRTTQPQQCYIVTRRLHVLVGSMLRTAEIRLCVAAITGRSGSPPGPKMRPRVHRSFVHRAPRAHGTGRSHPAAMTRRRSGRTNRGVAAPTSAVCVRGLDRRIHAGTDRAAAGARVEARRVIGVNATNVAYPPEAGMSTTRPDASECSAGGGGRSTRSEARSAIRRRPLYTASGDESRLPPPEPAV